MFGIGDDRHVLVERQTHIEPDHLRAGHHERGDLPVIETEHIAHHGVLVLFNDPGFRAFDQHGVDFLFRNAGTGHFTLAKQTQQQGRGIGQQQDEGARQHGEHLHRARHQASDAFRIDLTDPLGHQLTYHDGDIGDDHHNQNGGAVFTDLGLNAQTLQPFGQRSGQCRFPDNPVEDADRGDADLNGGQETGRVFAQFDGNGSGLVAFFGTLGQARLARRHQSDLRHGKQAIKHDEADQDENFHVSTHLPYRTTGTRLDGSRRAAAPRYLQVQGRRT